MTSIKHSTLYLINVVGTKIVATKIFHNRIKIQLIVKIKITFFFLELYESNF